MLGAREVRVRKGETDMSLAGIAQTLFNGCFARSEDSTNRVLMACSAGA